MDLAIESRRNSCCRSAGSVAYSWGYIMHTICLLELYVITGRSWAELQERGWAE